MERLDNFADNQTISYFLLLISMSLSGIEMAMPSNIREDTGKNIFTGTNVILSYKVLANKIHNQRNAI